MWEERLPTAREAPRRKDVTSWRRQMLGLLAPFKPCVAFVRVYNACDLDSLVETFYTEDAHLLPPLLSLFLVLRIDSALWKR
jgi:hypothetical protein